MFKLLKQRLTDKFPIDKQKDYLGPGSYMVHDLHDTIMEHFNLTCYEGGEVAQIVSQQLDYEGFLDLGSLHFKMLDGENYEVPRSVPDNN